MNQDTLLNDTFNDTSFLTKLDTKLTAQSADEEDLFDDCSSPEISPRRSEPLIDDSMFLTESFDPDNQENESIDCVLNEPMLSQLMGYESEAMTSSPIKARTVIESDFVVEKDSSEIVESGCNELVYWGLPESVLRKYESKGIRKMFDWQVECLRNKEVCSGGRNLVYSAPTSAGKTLVAEILAVKTIFERKKKVIFILPFVSVVREKMFYFEEILGNRIRVEGLMGSYNPPGGFKGVQLAVCTIEKANSLINKLLLEKKLSEVGLVIVDELHLIGDSHRGYLLELLLTKLLYVASKSAIDLQIVGMSATLPNLNLIARWLRAELYTTDYRPIPLEELACVNSEIYNKDLKLVRKLPKLIEFTSDTDNILQLTLETIKIGCSVLIFCPSKNWCESLSEQLAAAFWKLGKSTSEIGEELRVQLNAEKITETLTTLKRLPSGLDKILEKSISFGVAFHHAGLTIDERDVIEGAFRCGTIKVLIATSTLSSGVNLPAKRVIIRTPIFQGKPLENLVYRQMVGRAGRMGKDTSGESILVCQKNEYNIAKKLMSEKLNPIESCLYVSGKLKRALLEVVASGIVTDKIEAELFIGCTLLAVEDINEDYITETIDFLERNEFIRLINSDGNAGNYQPTALAQACFTSSLPPEEGLALLRELQKARDCFVLSTDLHLVYSVTPYSTSNQLQTIDWIFYLQLFTRLPQTSRRVAELVGVSESFLINSTRCKPKTNTAKELHGLMVHKRFYAALMLSELIGERPLRVVAEKYGCSRGLLQSLQQSAAVFAGMVTGFCRELGWRNVEMLVGQFQDRLQFGVSRDLLDLLRLPYLTGRTARALYDAGVETLVDLASSDPVDVEDVLRKLSPFESARERDGESDAERRQRTNGEGEGARNLWIPGRRGMSEREAAEMFVEEAKRFLQLEMGLVRAEWGGKGRGKVGEEGETREEVTHKSDDGTDSDGEVDVKGEMGSGEGEEVGGCKNVKINEDLSGLKFNCELDLFNNVEGGVGRKAGLNLLRGRGVDGERKGENNRGSDPKAMNEDLSRPKSDFPLNLMRGGGVSEGREAAEIRRSESEAINEGLSRPKSNFPLNLKRGGGVSDGREGAEIRRSESEAITEDLSRREPHSMWGGGVTEGRKGEEIRGNEAADTENVVNACQSDDALSDVSFELRLSESPETAGNSRSESSLFDESSEDARTPLSTTTFENLTNFDAFARENPKPVAHKRNEGNRTCPNVPKKIRLSDTFSDSFEIVDVCSDVRLFRCFSDEQSDRREISVSVAREKSDSIGVGVVVGVAVSWGGSTVYYVEREGGGVMGRELVDGLVGDFLKSGRVLRVFDCKEQIKALVGGGGCGGRTFGCELKDPKVADWILEPEGKEKNLQAMAIEYKPDLAELTKLIGHCKGVGSVGMDVNSSVNPRMRACVESLATWHITDSTTDKLTKLNGKQLKIYQIEMKTLACLTRMEQIGFGVSNELLQNLTSDLRDLQTRLEHDAYSVAGRRFCLASPTDVAKVLGTYKKQKRTKTTRTTRQILSSNPTPLARVISEWRKVNSTLTKTLYPFLRILTSDRIFCTSVTHTSTGRITMHEPNLQNVPRDFVVGEDVVGVSCRSVFVAKEGCVLVSADYCQLELRLLAHLSGDGALRGVVGGGEDVFRAVAGRWYGVQVGEVTDLLRQRAKQICYGIIYGMGVKSLSEQMSVTEEEANDLVEDFHEKYPGIRFYINRIVNSCKENGYVETITGRRRYLPNINHRTPAIQNQAARQAVNTTIQGSAADLAKIAMTTIAEKIETKFGNVAQRPELVLHLHDELLYEVPVKYTNTVARLIKKCMENCIKLSIPFPVKIKTGNSWGNMTEIDPKCL